MKSRESVGFGMADAVLNAIKSTGRYGPGRDDVVRCAVQSKFTLI